MILYQKKVLLPGGSWHGNKGSEYCVRELVANINNQGIISMTMTAYQKFAFRVNILLFVDDKQAFYLTTSFE